MNKRVNMTNSFRIKDSTQVDYVCEFTEYLQSQTFGTSEQWEEGLKYFERDSDGAKLNRIADNAFQVVETGELVFV